MACGGEAIVVGVVGAPGAGKSRLCYEFAGWCRSGRVPVYEARAQLYGHATQLQPVLEFLRSVFFGVSPNDDASAARGRVAERLLTLGPTFDADLPLMLEFLGLAEGGSPASRLDPKARRARLLDIVRHMVRKGGDVPSVIMIEDLHWLDDASQEFVATLVDAVAKTRVMLLLNFRPGYSAPWIGWPYYRQIPLQELSPSHTAGLVEELAGGRPELDGVRRRVAERSGGNPFFAEELVRSLRRTAPSPASSWTTGWARGTTSTPCRRRSRL
jgi:predicted ATPase